MTVERKRKLWAEDEEARQRKREKVADNAESSLEVGTKATSSCFSSFFFFPFFFFLYAQREGFWLATYRDHSFTIVTSCTYEKPQTTNVISRLRTRRVSLSTKPKPRNTMGPPLSLPSPPLFPSSLSLRRIQLSAPLRRYRSSFSFDRQSSTRTSIITVSPLVAEKKRRRSKAQDAEENSAYSEKFWRWRHGGSVLDKFLTVLEMFGRNFGFRDSDDTDSPIERRRKQRYTVRCIN